MTAASLIEVQDLAVAYPAPDGRPVPVVDGISFRVERGQTLGLVGESGCGKSTVGRAVLRLVEPAAGAVRHRGDDLAALAPAALRERRRALQMIFQDPYASLNPRMAVGDIVAEPVRIHRLAADRRALRRRVLELLVQVGLSAEIAARYPGELSGGQRQRVGIARALAAEPEFIVCDEPVSALDVSIQAQIVNLLRDLQRELGLAYLFIAHGLQVVAHMSDRIAVMYLGRLVEVAEPDALIRRPYHPYTQALISAVPLPDPPAERVRRRILLGGEVPNAFAPPSGCRFHPRCPYAVERCRAEAPALTDQGGGHLAACWLAGTVGLGTGSAAS